ncbi:MAG: molybdopterin molybdotransferase MoeA [Pseudomonadota bacterium]
MADLLPLEEALAVMIDSVSPLDAVDLPLLQCDGLVLAQDVIAQRTQPPSAVSAMDGYALPIEPSSGQRFEVLGEVPAGGHWAGTVGAGQAVRIFTGAPVPAGASHVLIQEDAVKDGAFITVGERAGSGANIRPAGGDFSEGDRLLRKGMRLTPQKLALAASGDHGSLNVQSRPTVTILMNGDELRWPQGGGPFVATKTPFVATEQSSCRDKSEDGSAIVASNGFGVATLAERFGGKLVKLDLIADDRDALGDAIACSGADLLVTIGGTSVGDYDLVRPALEENGYALSFPKVALRPGKPTIFGTRKNSGGSAYVLGLPGNPVSALVSAMIFMRPLIAALSGRSEPLLPLEDAIVGAPVPSNGPRAHFMRARRLPDGSYAPVTSQDSSLLQLLSDADALLYRPSGANVLAVGTSCEIMPLPL